jgi:hypothetical protein
MGCPALGIWVAFLKQPDALPGRAKNYFFWSASPAEIPNAGHPIKKIF